MYFLLLLFAPILAIASGFTNSTNTKSIRINTQNVLLLRGEITEKLATQFVYEINQKPNKKNLYVFLDTNGGSVDAGNKIVGEIQKYDIDCIAHKAVSMGFIILQSCRNRYITPLGTLMQHQMSYVVGDEKAKVESYVNFIKQIGDYLNGMQADKIGISHDEMRTRTYNDWWLFGENAVQANCVDQIASVTCSSKLTNQTYLVENGSFNYVYSKCPLVTGPIDKIKNKNKKNMEDYLFLL
jgi:ATP-dependent protease ClpP protease subunit